MNTSNQINAGKSLSCGRQVCLPCQPLASNQSSYECSKKAGTFVQFADAVPGCGEKVKFHAHRIQKGISDLLSISVAKTRTAELAPHPNTLWVPAVGFGVCSLLAALMASGSLRGNSISFE